jgi:16S rRNA (cytosine967-C5)-methyltransferase
MNVRKLAVDAVEKIIDEGAYANIVVDEYLKKQEMSEADRSLFTRLTYGTVERLLTLEYYLEPFIKKAPKPWVKYLLYLSCYQLLYLKIPEYAVLNEAVSIANQRDRHVGGFVNGVLRNFLRQPLRSFEHLNPLQSLSIRYSHPEWVVSKLLADYEMGIVARILSGNLEVRPVAIRINTLKADKETVKKELLAAGFRIIETELVKDGLQVEGPVQHSKLFRDGLFTVQDLAAQVVGEVMAPGSLERIIDLCSAPGGKAAHLAALMANQGQIIACDIHPHKLKLMEKGFSRLGVKNVAMKLLDARKAAEVFGNDAFDQVLADVPCSGLGVMGHKVDLKYHLEAENLTEIVSLQREILKTTWSLVKPGGYYTYSTCTINKEENEQQIREFLKTQPEAVIVSERTILPFEYQTDGFYICKLRRQS